MSGTTAGASGTAVGRSGTAAWPSGTTDGTAHKAYHKHREEGHLATLGAVVAMVLSHMSGTTARTAAEPDTRKPRVESRRY